MTARTGLSVFDDEYIRALPEPLWYKLIKENAMITNLVKSELEVRQSGEGVAKAELEVPDRPELFERLVRALGEGLNMTEEEIDEYIKKGNSSD